MTTVLKQFEHFFLRFSSLTPFAGRSIKQFEETTAQKGDSRGACRSVLSTCFCVRNVRIATLRSRPEVGDVCIPVSAGPRASSVGTDGRSDASDGLTGQDGDRQTDPV